MDKNTLISTTYSGYIPTRPGLACLSRDVVRPGWHRSPSCHMVPHRVAFLPTRRPRQNDIVTTLSPGELLSERNLQSRPHNLALIVRPGEWPGSICRPAHGTTEPTVRQAEGSCVVSPLRPLFANAKWRAGSPAPFDQANGGRPRSQVAPTYDAGPTFCFGEGSSIPA
jgi:hypothetical protein